MVASHQLCDSAAVLKVAPHKMLTSWLMHAHHQKDAVVLLLAAESLFHRLLGLSGIFGAILHAAYLYHNSMIHVCMAASAT